MTERLLKRRGAIALLAGVCAPTLARADDPPTPAPVPSVPVPPQIVTPPPPAITTPVPPAPPRAAPAPAAAPVVPAIDKSKIYYVFFDQGIDVASMRVLRRQLALLVDAGVSEINLVLSSAGGLVTQTLITYSFIRALPARVNTFAQGLIASAATVLFLAGEERTADPTARFLFHPVQAPISGALGDQQLHETLSAFQSLDDVYERIYKERTTLPPTEIARFERAQVIYTADQAREFGIVQSVAGLKVPGEGKAKIILLD